MSNMPPFLDCFALEPEIARLQDLLPHLDGAERIDGLVALAWHLRQRDSRQALTLADYAAQLNQETETDEAERRARLARLALARAHAAFLNGDVAAAQTYLDAATPIFEAMNDDLGAGDAQSIAAMLAWHEGSHARELDCWNAALAHYSLTDDLVRRDVAAASVSIWLAQHANPAASRSAPLVGVLRGVAGDPSGLVPAARSDHPGVEALKLCAQGYAYERSADHARKAVAYARASRLADEAGMLRLSILAATRTAQGFLDLGDTDAASVWCDQAYGLARRNNWAWSLAKCHVVFGDLLRRIGSLERSRDIYLEAMPAAGRGLSRCQWGLARTLLALGSAEEALPLLADAAESAERLHDAVGFCGIELERARALTQLDRCDEAFAQIARAQARAAEEAITLFDPELLEAQADVVTRRGAAPEPGRTVSQAVAALLQEAIETGSRQPDWRPPPTLLIKLARAQSANGDLSAAVANYERSILATDIDLARRVRDRVAAAQAQEEIERARREAEEQQSLALAESSRANDLQAVIDAMRETQEALARRTEELERLSMLDALTGVPNRRHLDERAAAEMALMRRKSTLLALVLFDLDHFKMINDTYGHAAGDIVLKTVAETARGLLRPSDFIARIGGEEFTLLLPRTNLQGAATIADRIRQSLMALNIIYAEFRIPVTASFGVTLLSENDGDITEAMSRADIALYRAKRDGRNMVRIEAV